MDHADTAVWKVKDRGVLGPLADKCFHSISKVTALQSDNIGIRIMQYNRIGQGNNSLAWPHEHTCAPFLNPTLIRAV